MDEFIEQDFMVKDGIKISKEEFSKIAMDGGLIKVFKNSKYQVIKRVYEAKDGASGLAWLSIRRLDREPIHDWRDLQEIKNKLVGRECEGVELYPAMARLVDCSNQFHLWVFTDPKVRLPFGFKEGMVCDSEMAKKHGAKQRPLREG